MKGENQWREKEKVGESGDMAEKEGKSRERKVCRHLAKEMETENFTDVSESVVKMSNFTLYLYE